ncbi:MAG: TlyA family RNA methyltransferase [Pseudonocardiales bacterium]
MTRWARLDAELVRRGLAASRAQAAELVASGRVRVDGQTATKPATGVAAATALLVADTNTAPSYASRGGHKLAGALDDFSAKGLTVDGRRCLDAGASTGGFTDVLLRRGATEVVAADVGYGQLAWSLQMDPRVRVLDRTNVRTLTPEHTDGPVDVIVADLSFIALGVVLGALASCLRPGGDLVPMVKPQFEVGRAGVGRGGVVRDPQRRATAVLGVAETAAALGLGVAGVSRSVLPGPAGNVEFFLWLRVGAPPADPATLTAVTVGG